MSIRIEVTGESIPEIADKLGALARSLTASTSCDVDNAARDAKAKPKAPAAKSKASEGNAPATGAAGPQESTASSNDQSATSTTQTGSPQQTPTAEVAKLDFDTDVGPRVLEAVDRLGRETVVAILEEFGVAKASQLAPDRWSELLSVLKDRLGD